MRLTPGVDYDPERVRRFRRMTRRYRRFFDGMSRETRIRLLAEGARLAASRPPTQLYRIDRVWHPALGRRVDLRDPEARVPEAEVRAWQKRKFGRTGLRYPVAACLAWLDRDFGP